MLGKIRQSKKCLLTRIRVFGQTALLSVSLFEGRDFLSFPDLKFILPFSEYSFKCCMYHGFSCLLGSSLGNKVPHFLLFNIWNMVEGLIRDKKLWLKGGS